MLNKVYSLFFHPGEVMEIRALGLRGKNPAWEGSAFGVGIVSGYFNDPAKIVQAAAVLDKAKARGVYFTINPCKPVLLSRAANRLICPEKGAATPDIYMNCIRWFLVDMDAKLIDGTPRPPGVSASEEELKVCLARTEEVAKYLEDEHGFSRAIRAFSGNGYHLTYRIEDMPNDDEHKDLIRNAMAALALKFGEDIDISVINPGRIWKFYGTTGRKGDSLEDRPHRKSFIFDNQPTTLADVPITKKETLKKFAALAEEDKPEPKKSAAKPAAQTGAAPGTQRHMTNKELGALDMEKYLTHFGIAHTVKEINDPKKGRATAYMLEHCIFNPDHSPNEASIIVPDQGAIKYQCFHASCKRSTWKDARYKISGETKLTEYRHGYDPNWKPPMEVSTGLIQLLPDPNLDAPALMNGHGHGGTVKVPRPGDMNPREFFVKKRNRPVFVPKLLAKYLYYYLYPLANTMGKYYHYENGTWQEYPATEIQQIIVQVMHDDIQAAWVGQVRDTILAGMTNHESKNWPKYPELVNVKNGMYNVITGELLPHSPEYGSFVQLPVTYNPDAWSERWVEFLKTIFFDDDKYDKRGLLQQFFGYCLIPDARYQKALFLYGTGANGKSTVLDVLEAMIGQDHVSSLSLADLATKFRASFLEHKLVNSSSETSTSDAVESAAFKQVVDGSPIMTEQKYGSPYQFRNYAKWIVSINSAPVMPDKSYAMERRVLTLNFNRRIEPQEIIPNYAAHLIEEIDGVFNWTVQGLRALLKHNGFLIGDDVRRDTDTLMDAINPFRIFITECCEMSETKETATAYYAPTTDLWFAYSEWCKQGHNRPLGRNKFLEQVLASFIRVRKGRYEIEEGKFIAVFYGVRLTEAGEQYAHQGRKRIARALAD